MLLVGSALALTGAVANELARAGSWKTGWMLGLASILVWLALQRADAARWRTWLPISLGVALCPLACALDPVRALEVAAVPLVPIVIAVLFLEAFDVVAAVSVGGGVSSVAFFGAIGWPAEQVVTLSVFLAAAWGIVLFASSSAQRLRALERQLEAKQDQALKLSETRRAQAERLAVVGRLASGVAHEINNPLAFVKANVGELKRSFVLGEDPISKEELAELLDDTMQGVERICQIVADLKGFAREDSGSLEAVDLYSVVNGTTRLAAVRLPRDVKVELEVSSLLPRVRANQRKLAQVFLNLLVNAADALEGTPARPVIAIRAKPVGQQMRITVTDNGPGIPADVLPRLFEPFFTTKEPGKGTGLGLALSREYVESFGGSLSVQNVEPRGAEFTILLPLTANTGETPRPGSLDLGPQREALLRRHRRRAG
ncbi:MAG: sensor histidine kinase [Myxococcota bacterium]